jgi:hypothetical protein
MGLGDDLIDVVAIDALKGALLDPIRDGLMCVRTIGPMHLGQG